VTSVNSTVSAHPPTARIVQIVLSSEHILARPTLLPAVSVTILVHGILIWLALLSGPSLENWAALLGSRIHQALDEQETISIEIPAPKPPQKSPTLPPKIVSRSVSHTASVHAQASQVITRTEDDTPVDFGENTIITGTSNHYAGGFTTRTGKSTQAVDRQTPVSNNEAKDLSHPVILNTNDWNCAWPAEADSSPINEQVVTIQVTVNVGGQVMMTRALSNPGLGFAEAALACARHTHFQPATDRTGQPYQSQSPPIRVRFLR